MEVGGYLYGGDVVRAYHRATLATQVIPTPEYRNVLLYEILILFAQTRGTTDHGKPGLLCTPTAWTDVITFLLANYITHAATVKSNPGEPALRSFVALATALIYPAAGIVRGLDGIFRHAVTSSSPLQTAKKAGALCTVVRTRDWQPQSGDVVQGVYTDPVGSRREKEWRENVKSIAHSVAPTSPRLAKVIVWLGIGLGIGSDNVQRPEVMVEQLQTAGVEERNTLSEIDNQTTEMTQLGSTTLETCFSTDSYKMEVPLLGQFFEPTGVDYTLNGRKVHGVCSLPPGFALAIVGPQATVVELHISQSNESSRERPKTVTEFEISSSSGLSKGLVAIFQTLYASVTLYRTRGDQIDHYGYAAFGLTVIPYLVMSVVNLISTILSPEYPTIYMVESRVMGEAKRRDGAYFAGTVGRLDDKKRQEGSLEVEFLFDHRRRKYIGYHPNGQSAEPRDCVADVDEALEVTMSNGSSVSTKPTLFIPPNHADPLRSIASKALREFMISMTGLVIGLISLAIYGGLSGFRARQSTTAERVLTMLWLVVGIWQGFGERLFWLGLQAPDKGMQILGLPLNYMVAYYGTALII
ncbi:MAG: hypothetical protein Q9195_000128 [Heterodermia aff. obscurata]